LAKSGGIATNIGVHFFDMLIWVFGAVTSTTTLSMDARSASGTLTLERADVKWFLSIDQAHIPDAPRATGKRTFRSLQCDGEELEFSDGFTDLHTQSYAAILAGQGFGLAEAKSSIELIHDIRKIAGN
jgi:UDP-N-acetyl-2-amino-2-deoxyglucuronate dehydrogenase